MLRRDQPRRQDADAEVGGKQGISLAQMEIDLIRPRDLDAVDDRQGAAVRGGGRGIQHRIIGGLDVGTGQPLTIAEVSALLAQGEAVVGGGQPLPVGQGGNGPAFRIEGRQAPVQEPVDALGGGVGGQSRVQVTRGRRQAHPQGFGKGRSGGLDRSCGLDRS